MRNGSVRRLAIEINEEQLQPDRVGAGMERWQQQFPDIDCSGKAIVGRLLHLNEVFLAAIDRKLARHGFKYPAFAVLATLRVQGEPYRMSPKSLLETLILTSGGLSNLLRRLEAEGLISRRADEMDGRGVIVELTEEGRRRVEPAMRDHADTERKIVSRLTSRDQSRLAIVLSTLMPS